MFSSVPFGPGIGEYMAWMFHGGGLELARELFARHDLHNIPCAVIPPEASGWFRKEICTVADLRGLRMRFFGLGAKVMEKLGVETHLIPPGDVCRRLEDGSLDAAEFSLPAMDQRLGFHQVAKHYYFPRQQEYAHHIIGGGEHLLEPVNEVLDLAGAETGRLPLTIERVSLAETLAKVGDILRPVAAKAGVTLHIDPAARAPDVAVDALRLRQVLINLVSNAIKYNRRGGSVAVSAMPAGADRLRIVVADTGKGIPEERQAQLFEPFHRLGAERSAVEGTGLGLALGKRLVEAMGGTIGFASRAGAGSTFWVEPATVESGKAAASALAT